MSDEVRIAKLNTLLKTFGTGSRITECSDGPGYTLWEWERRASGGTEYPATYENIEELEANVQRVIRSTQKFKLFQVGCGRYGKYTMRRFIAIVENAQEEMFGPIFHRSSAIDDFADFDLTKASHSAVLGPAVYATFGDSTWDIPGAKNLLTGYVKGKIIDLTKPLETEDALNIGSMIGRTIDVIPLITLERRYGSVAAGLKAAGYSAAIHEGPGTTGKHIAVFDPSTIIRPPRSNDN